MCEHASASDSINKELLSASDRKRILSDPKGEFEVIVTPNVVGADDLNRLDKTAIQQLFVDRTKSLAVKLEELKSRDKVKSNVGSRFFHLWLTRKGVLDLETWASAQPDLSSLRLSLLQKLHNSPPPGADGDSGNVQDGRPFSIPLQRRELTALARGSFDVTFTSAKGDFASGIASAKSYEALRAAGLTKGSLNREEMAAKLRNEREWESERDSLKEPFSLRLSPKSLSLLAKKEYRVLFDEVRGSTAYGRASPQTKQALKTDGILDADDGGPTKPGFRVVLPERNES
jgi:hypothetical protein